MKGPSGRGPARLGVNRRGKAVDNPRVRRGVLPIRSNLRDRPGRGARNRSRRATALVAILIALIVVQVAVAGVVVLGARDQDLTIRRLEGARAMYAAEGAANMALREWMTQTDADGDGGIGTISNNNNDDDDPFLGSGSPARFCVSSRVSGSNKVLVVKARCGSAVRQIEITVSE